MSGPFSVHATNSIDIPFTVLAPDGSVDTTMTATATTASGVIRAGVRPDNSRIAFVDGLSAGGPGNVVLSVTEGGVTFTDSFLVSVTAAPNRGAILSGTTASAEYPTPTSR